MCSPVSLGEGRVPCQHPRQRLSPLLLSSSFLCDSRASVHAFHVDWRAVMVRRQRHVGGSKRRQAANQRCDGREPHGDGVGGSLEGRMEMEMEMFGWIESRDSAARRCFFCFAATGFRICCDPSAGFAAVNGQADAVSCARRWLSKRVMSCRDLAPSGHAREGELISTALRHKRGGLLWLGWGDAV